MNKFISLILGFLPNSRAFGENSRLRDYDSVGWYTYNGDHKLTKRWKVHTEYQELRIDFIRTWQQSLARLGLIYRLTERVKVSGGYTTAVMQLTNRTCPFLNTEFTRTFRLMIN